MAHHDADPSLSTPNTPHLNDIVDARLQDAGRRGLLRGSLGASALGFMGGATGLLAGCGSSDSTPDTAVAGTTLVAPTRPAALGFTPIAKSLTDSVVVAAGYTATRRDTSANRRSSLSGSNRGSTFRARNSKQRSSQALTSHW